MYSEQLEQLIKSVIADGIITEKERAVLHKKAAAEGIDEDEIDVYVDGLLAKSDVKQPVKKEYDMRLFDKLNGRYYATYYYQFQKFYKVPSKMPKPITDIWIGLIDVVTCEKENYIGTGIIVCLNMNKNTTDYAAYPSIIIKTDIGTFKDGYGNWYNSFQYPSFDGKTCDYYADYQIDADQLKMLAESTTIQLSLRGFKVKPIDKNGYADSNAEKIEVPLNNFNCPGLQTYIQCFYREVVDKNAYPDAVISEQASTDFEDADTGDGSSEASSDFDPEIAAGLLSVKTKTLEKQDAKSPHFTQYKGLKGIMVTHIAKKKEINTGSLHPYVRLHALSSPKGATTFYLGYVDDSKKDFSTLSIRVNMKEHILDAIVEKESCLNRDYVESDREKFNFYPVDFELLKELLTTKTGVTFDEQYKVDKLPKAWGEAFNLLSNKQAYEQWKKAETEARENNAFMYMVKHFIRTHKILVAVIVFLLLLWILL